ncbi:MAG: hypothetical protein F6K18_00905 [Okeania sp. SIO2C2]|uniref:hypothetical protein n=1 Tax=Okeania sp. SIO2C2 TaxID=2607787 RepID=UPI0013B6E5D3|nr:hypothetical protein [Okeania sp. SIO2C2]NEP85496.1 hypothetical protein [Okeania sp. SIO2C2]
MKLNSKNHKQNPNERVEHKSPHPFLLALILTGILAAEAYPNLTETAIAAVKELQSQQLETNTKINYTTNKFANLIEFATETNIDDQTEISQPFFLKNKSINQILAVSEPSMNQNFDDLKKISKPTLDKVEKIADRDEIIPNNIVDAVREDLSNQTGILPKNIKVTQVSQEIWPNTCLGLANSDELCGQRLVEGWYIILSDGNETWSYRTDNKGKSIRVEAKN